MTQLAHHFVFCKVALTEIFDDNKPDKNAAPTEYIPRNKTLQLCTLQPIAAESYKILVYNFRIC